MKKKDNLLKGIIIGVCSVVLPIILMGNTNKNDKKIKKYEIHRQNPGKDGFLLNTETGDVWYLNVPVLKKGMEENPPVKIYMKELE